MFDVAYVEILALIISAVPFRLSDDFMLKTLHVECSGYHHRHIYKYMATSGNLLWQPPHNQWMKIFETEKYFWNHVTLHRYAAFDFDHAAADPEKYGVHGI